MVKSKDSTQCCYRWYAAILKRKVDAGTKIFLFFQWLSTLWSTAKLAILMAAISTHFVNWSIIINTYRLPSSLVLKGPKMSRWTRSMGNPAWNDCKPARGFIWTFLFWLHVSFCGYFWLPTWGAHRSGTKFWQEPFQVIMYHTRGS
jgi:hypothetical protein